MTGSGDLTSSVKTKVERLINHCEQLKTATAEAQSRMKTLEAERDQLQVFIRQLHSELDHRQTEIARLNGQLEVLKNAEAMSHSDERSSEVKTRINELMREIDNCIVLLSK